jgi:EF hand domain-containing protein
MRSMHGFKQLPALVAAGALAVAGAAAAQGYQTDTKKNAPAAAQAQSPATPSDRMAAKPMIPSKSETPDSAFKKLDASGKGYVSKDDVKDLSGFDTAFQLNDGNHDGQLTQDEFRRAWTNYSGNAN